MPSLFLEGTSNFYKYIEGPSLNLHEEYFPSLSYEERKRIKPQLSLPQVNQRLHFHRFPSSSALPPLFASLLLLN